MVRKMMKNDKNYRELVQRYRYASVDDDIVINHIEWLFLMGLMETWDIVT